MKKIESVEFWKLILACCRTRSLTRAAIEMDIGLPAASKAISAFEREEGLRILDRRSRPAGFTENLDRLYPEAKRIVAAWGAAGKSIESIREENAILRKPFRTVRISIPVNARNPEVYSGLLGYARGNNLRLSFSGESGIARLRRREVEIAQGGAVPEKSPDLIKEFARLNGFFLFASKEFERRYGIPKEISDLERVPIAIRTPETRASRGSSRTGRTFTSSPTVRTSSTRTRTRAGCSSSGAKRFQSTSGSAPSSPKSARATSSPFSLTGSGGRTSRTSAATRRPPRTKQSGR